MQPLREKLDSLALSQLAIQNALTWYRLTCGLGIPEDARRAEIGLRLADAQREAALTDLLALHSEMKSKEAGNV